MPEVIIRKIATIVEEVFHEGGPPPGIPQRRGAIMAVIENPYAGRYVADIQPFMDDLKPLGLRLAKQLIEALGGDAKTIEGYGKGAIVGTLGEVEHGALWHVPGGYAMRDALGGAKGRARAIVPSTKKIGVPGTRLDVPITHIEASYVRSHFDAMEIGLNDAPRGDELLFVLVMSSGARVQARIGGLAADGITKKDGLR